MPKPVVDVARAPRFSITQTQVIEPKHITMNYKTAERLKLAGIGVAVLIVVILIYKGCSGGSGKVDAIPRAGVGLDTMAVIKMDLHLMGEEDSFWKRVFQPDPVPEEQVNGLKKLRKTLLEHGVDQLVVPLNLGWSTFQSAGVYLGGRIRGDNEELETAIMKAGSGPMVGAAALFTAITSVGDGWKFWGVGGGKVSSSNASVGHRYEAMFHETGAAIFQIVVLGPDGGRPPTATNPEAPRLLRQLSRLANSAKGLQAFHLAIIPDPSSPKGTKSKAGAIFDTEESARQFIASWKAIADDLAIAAGSNAVEKDSNVIGNAASNLLDRLGKSAPSTDGRWIRWEDMDKD